MSTAAKVHFSALPEAGGTLDVASVTAAFRKGPHRHIDAGPGALAYWRFGRGPDVLLVHGWPLHAATFRGLVPELARRFTLHVFDLPGAGCTPWPDDLRHDIESHAAVLRRAIDTLGLASFAYLAHDSGGGIARIAAAGDGRVRGMVLGNTEIPGHHPWQVKTYVALVRAGLGSVLVDSLRLSLLRRGPLGFGGCFTDPAYCDGEFGELFVEPVLRSRDVARGQLGLARDLNFRDVDTSLALAHPRIQAPVLLVWGPDDPFFPVARARRMLSQFGGGAELVEIPRGKLFAHEDHAEAFVAHAAPFLQRCFDACVAVS